MRLTEIEGTYSILRYPPDSAVPDWLHRSAFWCVARTDEELSLVCRTEVVREGAEDREDNWACIKVEGPLDFCLTGILASIAAPLADAGISIFAISTFDTDYILVKRDMLDGAKLVLRKAGFVIS